MRPVLEAVAEWEPRENNAAVLAEQVSTALRRQNLHDATNGLAQPAGV